MVKVVNELTVLLENKPGMLLELVGFLAKNGVNIQGLGLSEGGKDFGVCRMVVDKPTRAAHLLGATSMMVLENPVLALSLPNRPGELARAAKALTRAKVNIEYAYGTAGGAGKKGGLFLRVSDLQRGLRTLRRL
jgi:hypothetical protein